jgi:hypothetical protein
MVPDGNGCEIGMYSTFGHAKSAVSLAAVVPFALVLLLSGCAGGELPSQDDVPDVQDDAPEGTEPLSGVELFKIYRDKTWIWEDGAGRFYIERRRFRAWVSNEEGESFGEGHYILSDNGELCMKATWTDAGGSADARSCFLHRTDGRTIYQKRKGRGEWYVFKHEEETPSDEYYKLVDEDNVSERVARIKAAFSGE